MQEEILIERFRHGDESAFIEIYERLFNDVYNFVAYSVSSDASEDLTQDIFIKVYKNMDKFKGKCSIKTWVFNIARRSIYDWYRVRKSNLNIDDYTNILVSTNNPENICENKEKIGILINELNQLKEEHKSVILLRKFHGFSIKETAEIMGYSESKVKTIMHRAVKALKDSLSSDYFKEGSAG